MPADYLPLVERISALDPPLFIFGGIAEDALLDGDLTRPHVDVDVIALREESAERIAQCGELGFDELTPFYEPSPGRPLVLGQIRGDERLELSFLDRDERGHYFDAATRDWSRVFRTYLPDDLFDHPPAELRGVAIRVLSPLALYQIRAGLAVVASFEERGAKDTLVQARLRERFFPDRTPEELMPELRDVSAS